MLKAQLPARAQKCAVWQRSAGQAATAAAVPLRTAPGPHKPPRAASCVRPRDGPRARHKRCGCAAALRAAGGSWRFPRMPRWPKRPRRLQRPARAQRPEATATAPPATTAAASAPLGGGGVAAFRRPQRLLADQDDASSGHPGHRRPFGGWRTGKPTLHARKVGRRELRVRTAVPRARPEGDRLSPHAARVCSASQSVKVRLRGWCNVRAFTLMIVRVSRLDACMCTCISGFETKQPTSLVPPQRVAERR